jgi:hypothetical protein
MQAAKVGRLACTNQAVYLTILRVTGLEETNYVVTYLLPCHGNSNLPTHAWSVK